MSPTTDTAGYLHIAVISLELILMVYVYQLRPHEPSNRLFAVYMLFLALSSSGALILGTADTVPVARSGAWLQATAALAAGPLLWLLTLLVYQIGLARRRIFLGLIALLSIAPMALMAIDLVTDRHLIFVFDASHDGSGYVRMASYLTGRFGPFWYGLNIVALNIGIVLPLAFFTFWRHTPRELKGASWVLLFAVILAGLVSSAFSDSAPVLVSMAGPVAITLSSAWNITRYRVFFPVDLAFRQAVDTASVGLLIFDVEGHLLEANAAAHRLLDLDQYTGSRQLTALLEHLAARSVNPDPRLIAPGASKFQAELQLIGTPGNPDRFLALSLEPIYQPGEIHIGTLCSVLDLTAERQAQAELRTAHQAVSHRVAELEIVAELSAALRNTRTLQEMLPIVLRQAATAVEAPRGAIFLSELETGELVARACYPPELDLSALRHRPGEGITGRVAATGEVYISRTPLKDPLARVLPGEEDYLQDVEFAIVLPLITPERTVGVMNIARIVARPFSDNDIRLLTAISDIAANAFHRAGVLESLEQRVAERTRELTETNERLKELDLLKSKFIADISHELRTPVTHFNLYLDLLERGKPERKGDYLTVLRSKSRQLNKMIEDILSVSRLDMLLPDEIKLTAVDLNDIVGDVVTVHHAHAESAGLTLTFEPGQNLPPILAERNQLLQAVTHLVGNAIHYTTDGGVRVSTGMEPARRMVYLRVEDTGMGIEAADLPHIFDRFYRGYPVAQSNIAGTGLGLAVVKEILDLHDSEIEVTSKVGVGTVFTVWLRPDVVTYDNNGRSWAAD